MKTGNRILIAFTTTLSFIVLTGLIKSSEPFHPSAEEKYRYVGMEKCASACHNNEEMGFQYNIVKKSPHANAYKILNSEKALRYAKRANITELPQSSQVCLKCHTTGSGLDSSFLASTYRIDDGVSCEACHKGAYISKTFIPKEDDCLKCHKQSIHRISRFSFAEKCVLIAHSRPKPKISIN